jgi:hypothetical protein
MVEMRFLQHLAKLAGANLRLQGLLFVFIQIVFIMLVSVAMRQSIQLLAFDQLFLNQAAPGRECRGRTNRRGRSVLRLSVPEARRWSIFVLLVLSAKSKETKSAGR